MLYNELIIAALCTDFVVRMKHGVGYEKRMEWNIEKVEIGY